MRWLLVSMLLASQAASPRLDVSTLKPVEPVRLAEIDLGRLKGDLRRLSWSPDGHQLSIATVEGGRRDGPSHAVVVAWPGGAVDRVSREPDWATAYWTFKSDRYAPGLPSIEIGVQQTTENRKSGTGPAGGAEREGGGGIGGVNGANDLARAAQSQERASVVRLTLFGATIAEFVNTAPLPGLTFGWAPAGSGALAYVDADGRLNLLDSGQHKRTIEGVRGALLPAWSPDGARLAYLQKSGRRKYALMIVALADR